MRKGIEALHAVIAAKSITVDNLKLLHKEFGDFKQIDFTVEDTTWQIFISDEYGECREGRPLLSIYMVLNALQEYEDSQDFLSWCQLFEVSPTDSVIRNYYIDLELVNKAVRSLLGDFEVILKEIHFQFPWRNKDDAIALLKNH